MNRRAILVDLGINLAELLQLGVTDADLQGESALTVYDGSDFCAVTGLRVHTERDYFDTSRYYGDGVSYMPGLKRVRLSFRCAAIANPASWFGESMRFRERIGDVEITADIFVTNVTMEGYEAEVDAVAAGPVRVVNLVGEESVRRAIKPFNR